MPGYLTTHVLDTARGCPASGVALTLWRLDGGDRQVVAQDATNSDGRTDSPILPEETFRTGDYELVFAAGAYLEAMGGPTGFLGDVPIRFTMGEEAHYHVPLLLSAFGYSTYRGS